MTLLMGNEALARGALEAGVKVCASYPGNPSSEVLEYLAGVASSHELHVEWSVNEKVALEVAAAASFAGLRALASMKQNGLNVAADFLFNLNLTGCRGGLVVVVCDDPGAQSSTNEQDTRGFAAMAGLPLLEPSDVQEAKDMVVWAFELSEAVELPVLLRSVTRLSHARGPVEESPISSLDTVPFFDRSRPVVPLPVVPAHEALLGKLETCCERFEAAPFNVYDGPVKPELLVVTSGTGYPYALEAVETLGLSERVGVAKVATTWPLPTSFLLENLERSDRVLFLEEVDPFLETHVKALWAQEGLQVPQKRFFGKASGTLAATGEITPDRVLCALEALMEVASESRPKAYTERVLAAVETLVPPRQLGFCAGCPHRASYWAMDRALRLDGRQGFVAGDIGCYTLGLGPSGYGQVRTVHAMGSGIGLANGFGQLERFGGTQPAVAVCGDSTFFHAALPGLINARYNGASALLVVLDNGATAMTGFQPHAGLGTSASNEPTPAVAIADVVASLGIAVEKGDPFDIPATVTTICRLLDQNGGVRVLILERECALVCARREAPHFEMRVDTQRCVGAACGCDRLCTRVFKCPGLMVDRETDTVAIDEALCVGCGVCADICPAGAILREER